MTMLKKREVHFLTAVFFWLFLFSLPWQNWLQGFVVLRFALGVLIYLFPGALTFLLLSEDKDLSLRIVLGGIVVSLFVTGLFGVIARVFHLNFVFIRWAFVGWGGVALLFYYFRPIKYVVKLEKLKLWESLSLVLVAGGVLYFSSLARPPLIHDDAFTYNALLYYYQHSPVLDFSFPESLNNLKTPRFWIAFWPLAEAMISEFSGVDGLLITGIYFPPLLACLSFIGIYVVARTLGLPRIVAGVALLAQGVGLMRLSLASQSGKLFFQRITEDKVAAAFLVSLILVFLAVEYLEKPDNRKLLLVWIAAWAMTFTHPVQFGMICMIVGVYGLPSILRAESRKKYLFLIVILASVLIAPYLFRFEGGEHAQTLSFSLEEVEANDEFFRLRKNRVEIIEGTQYYGISTYLTSALPYRIGVLSAFVSLFFLWRNKAARYVFASFFVLGVAVFPYTGWIVGMFTTPYQLWRLTWLMPLGISFAFLIWLGFEFIQNFRPLGAWRQWLHPMLSISVFFILIVSIFYLRPWAQNNLSTGNVNIPDFYANYINTFRQMEQLDVEGAPFIIGGPDAVTHSIIPSLTLRYVPLVFRVESGGRNTEVWRSLIGEGIPPGVRLDRLRESDVEYMLIKGDPDWVQIFMDEYPENIILVFKDQRLSLYRLSY